MKFLSILVVLLFTSFQSFAQQPETAKTPAKDVTASTEGAECKSGMAVRKLTVITKGSGCEVEYTKDGDSSIIGSAQNDSNYCGMLVSKVRNRLEDSGFTCTTK